MKRILSMFTLFLVLLIGSCSEGDNNSLEVYFEGSKALYLQLDKQQFVLSGDATARSISSDFTATGYHITDTGYEELIGRAKTKLMQAYGSREEELFSKDVAAPNPEGLILFGSNGREATGIYVFKAKQGFGWVTMTFRQDQAELKKMDLTVASVKEK